MQLVIFTARRRSNSPPQPHHQCTPVSFFSARQISANPYTEKTTSPSFIMKIGGRPLFRSTRRSLFREKSRVGQVWCTRVLIGRAVSEWKKKNNKFFRAPIVLLPAMVMKSISARTCARACDGYARAYSSPSQLLSNYCGRYSLYIFWKYNTRVSDWSIAWRASG